MSTEENRGSMFCLPSGFNPISFEESLSFLQMRWGSLAVLGETKGTCVLNDTNVGALFVGHEQTDVSRTRVGGTKRKADSRSPLERWVQHACYGGEIVECILTIAPLVSPNNILCGVWVIVIASVRRLFETVYTVAARAGSPLHDTLKHHHFKFRKT